MNNKVFEKSENNIYTTVKHTNLKLSDILRNINKEEKQEKFIFLITDVKLTDEMILNNKEFFGNHNTYICNYSDYIDEINNSLSPQFMPILIVAEKENIVSINPMFNLKKDTENV
jgi:hypothetical protein